MAERPYSSSSVPDFSTYPEEPAAAAPNLEATYTTYRRYSEAGFGEGTRLTSAAARLGNALGSGVTRLRDTAWQLRSKVRGSGPGSPTDLRNRARQMAQDEPLKVILAAGALGLVIGAGIRMWRDHD
jgi:hypothetical protein